MAKLKMLEEEGNKLVKIAHTMVAKDGEVRKKLFLGVTLILSLVGSFILCIREPVIYVLAEFVR